MTTPNVLVVIDPQNDFVSGSLAVPNAAAIFPAINRIAPLFPRINITLDAHGPNHCSFVENGGTWPTHCVRRTEGANVTPLLNPGPNPNLGRIFLTRKGFEDTQEAYSGFSGTSLAKALHDIGVQRIFIAGLATDFCVRDTALDARKNGFAVVVLTDCIAAVDPGTGAAALAEMEAAGCELRTSDDVATMLAEPLRYYITIVRTVTEVVEYPVYAANAKVAIAKAKLNVWNYAADRIDTATWHPLSSSETATFDATPAPSARK